MKKSILMCAFSVMIIALFSSCEAKVDGKYKTSFPVEVKVGDLQPDMTASMDGQQEFLADNTFTADFTAKVNITIENPYVVTEEFKVTYKGKWEMKEKSFTQTIDKNSVKIEFVKASCSKDDDTGKALSEGVGSNWQESEGMLKEILVKDSKSDVVELSKDKLVLKTNGKDVTYTKAE
jgi:hypothetical protein